MPASVWSYSYSACCWTPVAPPPGAADLLFARFGWSWLCVVTFRSKSVSAEVFRRTNHLAAPSQSSHQQHKITGREEQEENHKQPSVCRVVQQCKPSERQVSTVSIFRSDVIITIFLCYVVLLVSLGKAKPSGPTSTGAKSRQSTLSKPCEIARYEKVQPYIDTMCACKTSILRGGRELKRQRMWRRICIATKRQPPRKLTNKAIQWRPLMLPNQEPDRPHAPCTPYHLPVCTTP